ncbi:HesB/YadR/YfhF family protein [Paenibacillus chitinolyticus]|uniref:HesB/YadR/YfhF family protein n=1 Tax=Paenibacillus TaxID=44249 RepID=UPI001C30BC5A|nr:Fe-S cluster assembly protein HesB [Paenibacillus sp. GbtcB18]
MQIKITEAASDLFRKDWGFGDGDHVRIFVRYSGGGEDAFSFGIIKDTPHYPAVTAEAGGITFFMEEKDVWYLDGKDLRVDGIAEEIVLKRQ